MTARDKSVVVTGVSTGIGLATARVLARHGVHVFGSVANRLAGTTLFGLVNNAGMAVGGRAAS